MDYRTTIAVNEPIAITIGNFDGVHRGHQRLMSELCATAQKLNCKPVLVTFSPHTLLVVRPDIDLHYLTTVEEKLALAKTYGSIADSIVINFTPEVAAMSANDFMDSLCTRFTIRGVVIGADFSLGHNRMGNVAFLELYGQRHNLFVRSIQLEESERARISSTRIRTLVSAGQILEANEQLGHPVTLCDVVKHGNKRGEQLGFPTANLLPEPHKLLPANGVYAVRVHPFTPPENAVLDTPASLEVCIPGIHVKEKAASDSSRAFPVYNGVTNIGVRPTFNGKERIVEVHVLDAHLDLYDQWITVDFIARLRDEQRFASIEALKSQIAADVQQARQLLKQEIN